MRDDTSFTFHPHVYPQVECEPYLPLLSSRGASQPFGRYSFFIPLRVGGWVGLGGWLHTETVYPRNETVTHLSTNRARRRATLLYAHRRYHCATQCLFI